MKKHDSPIYRIPLTDMKPIVEEPPPPNSVWCSFCWKWHPIGSTGRYGKDGIWACAECVLDCYAMGALIGKHWKATKATWGFHKALTQKPIVSGKEVEND